MPALSGEEGERERVPARFFSLQPPLFPLHQFSTFPFLLRFRSSFAASQPTPHPPPSPRDSFRITLGTVKFAKGWTRNYEGERFARIPSSSSLAFSSSFLSRLSVRNVCLLLLVSPFSSSSSSLSRGTPPPNGIGNYWWTTRCDH